ncbi:probable endonuclease 4 [Branchiostoma floridae]|uniref:Probable endonuclease 4 n=1 Tax=Branchiostoma floridae TaxID=7739 RepID=A0A9J7N868_BRAFL|nr:probable endonuclease 4 [Branchiostoma floridae]
MPRKKVVPEDKNSQLETTTSENPPPRKTRGRSPKPPAAPDTGPSKSSKSSTGKGKKDKKDGETSTAKRKPRVTASTGDASPPKKSKSMAKNKKTESDTQAETGEMLKEKKRERKTKTKIKVEVKDDDEEAETEKVKGKGRKNASKTKQEVKEEPPAAASSSAEAETKPKRKAANKASVLLGGPGQFKKFVGAHVSITGGIENAVENAVAINARAFGLFLRSQRQWACKPMEESAARLFREACEKHGFSPSQILPHGSYLLNCGAPNPETLRKSREALVDELKRCEQLGLTMYNFHPGSSCGEITVEECLTRIADSINLAHQQTSGVTTVIENMSCQGNTVGGKFAELRGIIDRVEDKSRVGVCIDTCHAFAAGYNLSTQAGFDQMMQEFEDTVGFSYLRAMHINDSKGDVGCHLDRHENIGKGKIGIEGFRRVMNDPRLNNIPMILETPMGLDDEDEIRILYSLCEDL